MTRSNYLVLSICALLLAGIFFNVIVSSFPYNPLSQDLPWLSRSNVLRFKFFFPEGFAFFTRDPQEISHRTYVFKDKSIIPVNFKNGSTDNLFGISKLARFKLIKLQEIISQIENKKWRQTTVSLDLLLKSSDTIRFENESYSSDYYSGKYLITATKPIPWAWYSLENVSLEYSYIAIEVTND